MGDSRTLFLQPRWFRCFLFCWGVLGVAYGIELWFTAKRVPPLLGAVVAAWFAWTLVLRGPLLGLSLTDSEVVNRGSVRTTRIPIAEIAEVTMAFGYGRIFLDLLDGRRFRLTGAPLTGKHRQHCYDELNAAITHYRRVQDDHELGKPDPA